jgi:WD40 repeat protein/energy-coupling factor transporter ATP-binding protein EcfA2
LATSDVSPDLGNWGLRLKWLRELLQESPIRQQIIWLDCCYSGELLNVAEADPGDRGHSRDRCFIAASREFEVAYEEVANPHSVLTRALIEGLDPTRHPNRWVTNYTLIDHLNQQIKAATQRPIFTNVGEPIHLTRRRMSPQQPSAPPSDQSSICPYKGLTYFDCNDKDPHYFYGRTALTDTLLEQVRDGSFLAIVGASGSGKSSVLRAGLLHQLRGGQRLSGSDRWQIHIFTPGDRPMQNLGLAFLDHTLSGIERATQLSQIEQLLEQGREGLRRIVQSCAIERIVVVVDQLEEVFTLCQSEAERHQFFACLMGALDTLGTDSTSPLLLIIAMRADFFSKCIEHDYSGLADRLRNALIPIPPLNRDELRDAITKPARQVGLNIEPELVSEMLVDIEGAPGRLPLLQYTLTELWKQREDNCLKLHTYTRLGGVMGTLQQRADEVYQGFSERQQGAVRHIFLSLTQLNEGTEDTRRRVLKRDLISSKYPESVIDEVVQHLADEKLIVTSELVEKGSRGDRAAVVDVAHEALIRHWLLLRRWIEDCRDILRQRQKLEALADEWQFRHRASDYLLRGKQLEDTKLFVQQSTEVAPLSPLAQEFYRRSVRRRRNSRIGRGLVVVGAIALIIPAGGTLFLVVGYQLYSATIGQWERQRAFSFFSTSPDNQNLLLTDMAGNYKIWDLERHELRTLSASRSSAPTSNPDYNHLGFGLPRFSDDGQTIAALIQGTIRLFNSQGDELVTIGTASTGDVPTDPQYQADYWQGVITRMDMSPDGQWIVSAGVNGTIHLWNRQGEMVQTLQASGSMPYYSDVRYGHQLISFSPDSSQIAAIADGVLKLWTLSGEERVIGQESRVSTPNYYSMFHVTFSPDGQRIAVIVDRMMQILRQDGTAPATLYSPQNNSSTPSTPSTAYSIRTGTFSPDSQRFATFVDGEVKLWTSNGQAVATLQEAQTIASLPNEYSGYSQVSQLIFSPTSDRLALLSNGVIRLWDQDGRAIATLTNGSEGTPLPSNPGVESIPLGLASLAFSPDGELLVTGGLAGAVQLWDRDGNPVMTLQAPDKDLWTRGSSMRNVNPFRMPIFPIIHQLGFSANGQTIAAISEGTLKLWNQDGTEALTIRGDGEILSD